MSKPNIILILTDDLGCGDLGCFGGDGVETGSIDQLAREGVCLTQAYAGSPVCAPSRGALMTGRYPHRTGAIDTLEGRGLDRLALREVTLGDVMKQAGYATGLVGKWHLGALDPRFHPNRRGFDETVCFRGGWQDYYQWRLDYNGAYRDADGRYLTDVFSEEAVGFIERHRDEPFFLHVTYNAPHFPLQAPEEDLKHFVDQGRWDDGVSCIYAMNRVMDRGIGRMMETLEGCGIADNTLVIFTSDNGPQFGGPPGKDTTRFNGNLNGCKGLSYEGGIRVPVVMRWPDGLQAGREVREMFHFTDWLPTLASVAGVEPPSDRTIDGRNAMPAIREESRLGDIKRFWQWNRYTPVRTCNAAMRDGEWKLIRPIIREAMYLPPEELALDRALKYDPLNITDICREPEPERIIPDPPAPLLFNLRDDPFERSDLATVRPEVVSRMQNDLNNWFDSVEADRRSIDD